MPETGKPKANPARRRRRVKPQGESPTDPRKHAVQLLEQADQLVETARELRREARRLNASLGVPSRQAGVSGQPDGSPKRPARPDSPVTKEPVHSGERRFAHPNERPPSGEPGGEAGSDELQISDGARLLITNMAITGSTREELLALMEKELGLENADAILERLSI
jgi:hypothetical protein